MNSLSWIQRHVLIELTKHPLRRYSELRPKDVEGNLFMYHLKGVMKAGLAEKTESGYRLSQKGLKMAAMLSLKTGKSRLQPQILDAVIATNDKGEHLLSRWHRQPNAGLVSLPHGMLHWGESLEDMAGLELAEKAGLVGKLAYCGEVLVRVYREDEVTHHMLVHLFRATELRPGRADELRPEVSESFWAEIATLDRREFIPGFYQIAELTIAQAKGLIFADIAVDAETGQSVEPPNLPEKAAGNE